MRQRKFYRDNVGVKKAKEKSDKKLERDMMSDKQKHLDESGEVEIRYEDAWIADVYEPNDYDDQYLAKD